MSDPANNHALGTSHKSCAHLVFKTATKITQTTDHPNEVYNSLTPHTQQQHNSKDNTDDVINSQSSSTAAAVSPTDTITPRNTQDLTQVIATQTDGAPTHTMYTKSTSKRTPQTHITPNKQLTGYNWSNDNGTKASLEEATVQEVVPQQKLHGSNKEMFDKLQLLDKQPKGIETKKNGLSIDYSKRVTFQGDIIDRIAAVPTTVAVPTTESKIFTKKYPNEDNGLTCPLCAKEFASQGGLDYHVLLACQNKLPPSLDIIKNEPAKDGIRKKSQSKGKGGRIAKITSDYWQHGLQTDDTFNGDISAAFDESSSQLAAAGTKQKPQSSSSSESNKTAATKQKTSHALPNSTIDYLNECYSLNPYPYADQKARIALVTGLNKMQVEDWMARARMKQRKKSNRPSTTVSSVPGVKAGVQITIKELEAYMKAWISKDAFSRDWVLNLTPSPSQKDQIILETGIERNRLENWLYGARQKLIKHDKEKPGQGISVLRSAATVITIVISTKLPDTLDEATVSLKKNDIRPQGLSEEAKTSNLSEEAKTDINKWMEEHALDPFPTREVKDVWIKLYGIKKDYMLDGYLHRARKKIKENSLLSLKTCGICNKQKKKWSYNSEEWNKLDDRDRQCLVCISKVKTASPLNDDGPADITRTRTGRVVKSRERLVAIPQVQPVKRGRKRPRKITSARGTATSSGSTSRSISRKVMINEIQGVRRLTGSKNRWGAVLKVSGNDIFLGSYNSPTEAAHAVEMAKEDSKMASSVTLEEGSSFTGNAGQVVLESSLADEISDSLMDTGTAKDEELSGRISKYLSPTYQSEKQSEEQPEKEDEDEPADNLDDVMNIPIESVISKFEEARKAGYQPKTFDLQAYMAEHDKKYSYLLDVKNDCTNTSNKRRKKSTPKRLVGGLR